MPGIDPKSVTVLKEAKNGGAAFFALIVKSGTVGQMIANKTSKVPDKAIGEAKQECGATTVIKGRCHGASGTITFQTVKALDGSAETLARKLVKDAGVTPHCEFETNAEAENDNPSTSGQTGTTSGQTGTTQPQQGRQQDPAQGLRNRLGAILEWLKVQKPKPEMASVFERAVPIAREANQELQSGNLVEAEKKIALLENYCNVDQSGGSEETDTSGDNPKLAELHHRRNVIVEWLKSVKTRPEMVGSIQRAVPILKQVDEELHNGELVEAEKKLALVEKYLDFDTSGNRQPTTSTNQTTPPTSTQTPSNTPPQVQQRPNVSPGKQQFDNAKQGFDNFKLNPTAGWNSQEGRLAIQNLKREMTTLVTDELESEDDIKRKGTFFDSKDEKYKKNVTQLVRNTMNAVQPALNDPTQNTGEAITTLNEAMDLLAIQRAHYADMRGIKEKETEMRDQRRRKVEAIESHINEMKKINAKLRDVLKLKMKPAHDLLNSLPELMKGNPEDGGQAIKDFAKLLGEDEQFRQDLFQSVGPEHSDALYMLLSAQPQTENDKWCRELALTRATDPDFMDPMCRTAILAESSRYDQGTFFRENTTATKLAKNYAQNSPGGKIYCQNSYARYQELAKGKGTLEIDKDKTELSKKKKPPIENETEVDKQKREAENKKIDQLIENEIQKNARSQSEMLGQVIDDMTQDPNEVPPEIAKICKTFYEEAKRVSGNDEEFATTQSGGFLMLRVVVPSLTTASALEVNEINDAHTKVKAQAKEKWLKSGKKLDDYKPPEMSRSDKQQLEKLQEKQRLVMLQGKVLQNISNGVEAGDKEKYMIPMNSAVKQQGQYTPTARKLRDFLKNVAQRN